MMNLISVIVTKRDVLDEIFTYSGEDSLIIKKAEEKFKEKVLAHYEDSNEEDLANYLDDGYFTGNNYSVFITHHNLER